MEMRLAKRKMLLSAGISENGNTSDVHESISEHQLVDVSVSAEEERLWSIVRANSLDFDTWTALIEETEKAAELGPKAEDVEKPVNPFVFLLHFVLGAMAGTCMCWFQFTCGSRIILFQTVGLSEKPEENMEARWYKTSIISLFETASHASQRAKLAFWMHKHAMYYPSMQLYSLRKAVEIVFHV